MSTRTAQVIITQCMRDLNFIGRNANPTPNESSDALIKLNGVVRILNRKSLLMPYELITDKTLTNAVSLYTVGLAGAVAIARPSKIERASVMIGDDNDIEIPIYCAQSAAEWQQVIAKEQTSGQPSAIFYNPKTTLGELNVYPVPDGTPVVRLYTRDQLTGFALLTTTITMDDDMFLMLHYQLGLHLQPGCGVPLPENWPSLAQSTMADIKSDNIKPGKLRLDHVVGVGAHYDIGSDSYIGGNR